MRALKDNQRLRCIGFININILVQPQMCRELLRRTQHESGVSSDPLITDQGKPEFKFDTQPLALSSFLELTAGDTLSYTLTSLNGHQSIATTSSTTTSYLHPSPQLKLPNSPPQLAERRPLAGIHRPAR